MMMDSMRAGRLLSLLAVAMLACAGLRAGEAGQRLSITLPGSSELDKLADLTAQFAGVSIQYNPQKIRGSVRLDVRGQLTQAELWEVFNQVLVGQGFTTVVAGLPAVYQVVPITEAPGLSAVLSAEDSARLPYQPGYAAEVIELKHLGAEPTVKALAALFANQVCQVRTLGPEHDKLVIAAPQAWLREARQLLVRIDRPGIVPVVRMFRPQRTEPQGIQAAATAAWAAMNRISAQPRLAEVQVAPDGAQVVLIASGEDIDRLVELITGLDESEPVESRTYNPRFFSIDEVAGLLQRLLQAERKGAPDGGAAVVRDALTGSLIIRATVAQHRRIEEVMRTLEDSPATARRQVRSLVVKHRQAEEVAKLISSLRTSGSLAGGGAQAPAGDSGATKAPAPAPAANPTAPAGGHLATVSRDNDLVLAADPLTNRLIAMGDPRVLDQVQALVAQLDQRQPQVELEVVLVTLSSSQNLSLGVELVSMIQTNQVSGGIGSLFGLSQAVGGQQAVRSFSGNGPTGLGGIIMQPGDFAGVITALEKITDARSLIRSRIVANNNVKSTVDGVVQQPLTSNNASATVSTTSVTGTTDAGTQITITPQISVADYVTVTYAISQSTFLGDAVTTANGAVIPPPKRADTITSAATVPDGFVIGLGGLSNRTDSRGESRVPLLGRIPVLGMLFKQQSDTTSDSRFYVFIRANIMRHETFADLRRISERRSDEAQLRESGWPQLSPELMK
jgi:type II secretory pathway component GspD/PulD (secretin)